PSHTLSSIVLHNTTANFAPAQSTAATAFALTGSVLGGPGTLTNDAGQTMKMRSSGISAPFVNQGTIIANGASSLDALTTVAGSTLRVEGDGTSGVATLTVTGGMGNSGGIEMTDVGYAYGANLVVKTLQLLYAGTIAVNMQIPTSGIITIELGGPTPGAEYDQLAITGSAIFAEGTLNVSTIGAFDPKGLSFDVMTFGPGSTTGPIRTVNLPPLCSSGQVVNTGTSLRVTCP